MQPMSIPSGRAEKNLHAGRKTVRFRTRGFISLLLALSFLVAVVSGSVLFITPRGRSPTGLAGHDGFDQARVGGLHINACLLMLLGAVIHLVLNWRIFWSYIQKKSAGFNLKWEMAASVLITAAVVAGTLYEVPPLTATGGLNEWAKTLGGESSAGPVPHADKFTLARLAQTTGLEEADLVKACRRTGSPSKVKAPRSPNWPSATEWSPAGSTPPSRSDFPMPRRAYRLAEEAAVEWVAGADGRRTRFRRRSMEGPRSTVKTIPRRAATQPMTRPRDVWPGPRSRWARHGNGPRHGRRSRSRSGQRAAGEKRATPPPNSRVKHFHDDCSSCRRWPHLIGLDQFLARSVLNDSRCNQAPFPARIALAECVAAARLADCHTRSGGRHAEYNSFIRQRPNRSRRAD